MRETTASSISGPSLMNMRENILLLSSGLVSACSAHTTIAQSGLTSGGWLRIQYTEYSCRDLDQISEIRALTIGNSKTKFLRMFGKLLPKVEDTGVSCTI